MFDAMHGIKFGYVLCGVIWAIVLGFAVGNYACSLVHRLPRGRLILDKKPYCGSCGAQLQVRDLFPVVSALLLRHRCRYCATPFPVSHTWTEILVGLLFVLTFFDYNFGEQFVLIIGLGVFLITLAAIEANENMVMGRILLCIIVLGMLLRTLLDGSIYPFFEGGFAGLIAGAALWHKQVKPVGHIFSLPVPAKLLVIGGICVGSSQLIIFYILFALFYALDALTRKMAGAQRPALITVAFGLAVMLPVLYPKMQPFLLHALPFSHG
jgi:hypothetical protein